MIYLFFAISDEQAVAWERLFKLHNKIVFWAAHDLLNDQADAEDVVQIVFWRFVIGKHYLRTKSDKHIQNYLYRMARNEAYSVMRKRAGQSATEEKAERLELHLDADAFIEVYDTAELEQWLDRLSEAEKTVVLFRSEIGLNGGDIARSMGISRQAVYSSIKRAKVKILLAMKEADHA